MWLQLQLSPGLLQGNASGRRLSYHSTGAAGGWQGSYGAALALGDWLQGGWLFMLEGDHLQDHGPGYTGTYRCTRAALALKYLANA